MAATIDLSLTPISECVQIITVMLPDPENVGVAIGISLLCCIEAEIIQFALPVTAAIFDLTLTPLSESVQTSPAVLADPWTVGVASGISLLSFITAEILRYFICTSVNGGHRQFATYPDVGD